MMSSADIMGLDVLVKLPEGAGEGEGGGIYGTNGDNVPLGDIWLCFENHKRSQRH